MTNEGEHSCSGCGESCSEQDVATGGLCPSCDEAAAEALRAQAEEHGRDDEMPVTANFAEMGSDMDGRRW